MSLSQLMKIIINIILCLIKSLYPQTRQFVASDSIVNLQKDNLPPKKLWFQLKRHLCQLSGRKKGSYSVEAAVALPVFMGFAVCVMFFIRIVMIGWAIDDSLTQTVDTMALVSDQPNIYAASAMFYGKLLSNDVKLDGAVMGGTAGVFLGESSVDDKNITLTAVYRVNFPIRLFSDKGIFLYQKKSARIWNGYDPNEASGDGEYVYVTPYGRAYHRSRDCPYIDPSIKSMSLTSVKGLRNSSGHSYDQCPLCKKPFADSVYITSWGECYHNSVSCSGLKRTISMVKLSEAKKKYHACPKCGGS